MENIKSTIFIKNPIHPPLGFCPHAKTFRCAIPTIEFICVYILCIIADFKNM